jgi:hypothetical protein
VATRFFCPHRSTVRFDPVAKDLSFVPSLEHGPRWFAAQMEAPRFAFQVNGDTATLRLGNADGSLGSISTFSRADGQWKVVQATKCVNGPFLAGDSQQTGAQSSPLPSPDPRVMETSRGCSAPTFVHGHAYYDTAGLLRHEWTYAAGCPDGKVRLAMVTTQGSAAAVTVSSLPGLKPVDVSRLPFAADLGPGRRVGLWVLYDARHAVAGLSAELSTGQSLPAEAVDLRKHSGTLFLVLAPRDQVEQLTVHPVQGAATTYSQTNPPGYRR